MSFNCLADLYEHFDELASSDETDADILFTSSYLRGFLALKASNLGDEKQGLSKALAEQVSQALDEAKVELAPQDRVLVQQYWQSLQVNFT